ncbi:MAG TPA: glycosyl hydrolase [Fimbriimonadaceae bacterium]|nr:glycosyl hydrolase [Fimbriimonadaceae bacterium]
MAKKGMRQGRFAAVAFIFALLSIGFWSFASVVLIRATRHIVPAGKLAKVGHFERLVEIEPTAANWHALADAYVDTEQYALASDAYHQAADIYRTKNDINAAHALDRMWQRYETQVEPFIHRSVRKQDVQRFYTGARLEPQYGCYTGAFIDHEDSIRGTYRDEYGEWRRDVSAFNHLVGSRQAIFFIYLGYGRKFPAKFVHHVHENGGSAQIAFEPTDISQVEDDAYLRGWAREARDSHVPIFLRFASEMNGDWTSYHKDPALYIEKFRLVAKVMHEEAPNVAMVWCPFEIPQRLIEPYYPGPEAVDWVGVNIYSVPFNDNDPKRDAEWRNPSDALRFIYEKYASRHPIMVAEYAASHMSSLDMKDRSEFAVDKIGQFYAALPRLYPRVKAVCWLSMNAIKHAMPERQLNDYSLLESRSIRKRYEQMLYSPYYLQSVSQGKPAMSKEEILPLDTGETIKGKVGLSAWVKTYVQRPIVVWRVNGVEMLRSDLPGPYHWTFDTRQLKDGPATIDLIAYDTDGREVGRQTRTVEIENR